MKQIGHKQIKHLSPHAQRIGKLMDESFYRGIAAGALIGSFLGFWAGYLLFG